jgi:hypothetical protein
MIALSRTADPTSEETWEWLLNEMRWPAPTLVTLPHGSPDWTLAAERRTSGTCYGISGSAKDSLPIGNPRNTNAFNIRLVETEKRRPNHRMMQSGKTSDAIDAFGMIGIAGGQLRSALAVMDTKLEAGSVVGGTRREWETGKHNQQALRSDCVRYDNANQRSQRPLGPIAQPDHQTIPTISVDLLN